MNSSGLLDPLYLSIGLGLKLSSQMTFLCSGARAHNVPLPDGVGLVLASADEGTTSMPSFVNDVAQVGLITNILTLPTILSYSLMSITLIQASVIVGRRCFFTLSTLCQILRSVSNGGLSPMVLLQ
jgi:hypothetical protein